MYTYIQQDICNFWPQKLATIEESINTMIICTRDNKKLTVNTSFVDFVVK